MSLAPGAMDLDAVFADSFTRIMGQGAYNRDFIARFYDHFLASSPTVAMRFASTDMSRQRTMLHDSFTTLIDFSRHRRLTPQLERLAAVHGPRGNDIPPALYDLWLDSLMQTAAEFDTAWNRQVELAWRFTLAPGIAYLKFAGAHPDGDGTA